MQSGEIIAREQLLKEQAGRMRDLAARIEARTYETEMERGEGAFVEEMEMFVSELKNMGTALSRLAYVTAEQLDSAAPVSYTHLDVYKRQGHWSDSYWYDRKGNPTGSQATELWAEYYSYCMTDNEEALENLREHFPNAAKFLDEMAESMACLLYTSRCV